MKKTEMNQDQLYQYILAHNLTVKRLGEMIGQGDAVMSCAFKHNKMNGKPLYFSPARIARINEALPRMADEIQARLMQFHPENNISTVEGRYYDPSCVEQLRQVGEYFNVQGLTARILGWSKEKKASVLCSPANRNYGHITPEDVTAINTELLSVAGVLRSIEIIPMKDDTVNYNKCTRTRRRSMEQSFKSSAHTWDDTDLPLMKRYEVFHKEHANGFIFFRVNGGYTVCQDDARFLCNLDSGLFPYTDPDTGVLTAYMDADRFSVLLPHCVRDGNRIAVTDMYIDKI